MAFKTILDPEFKYRRAEATDLRVTFARIRREQQRRQAQAKAAAPAMAAGGWPFPTTPAPPTEEAKI
jgi:hypothetical protein